MKKVCSAALLVLSIFVLRTAAFADIAPLPNQHIYEEQGRTILQSPVLPIVIIIVIAAAVVLFKILRKKKK